MDARLLLGLALVGTTLFSLPAHALECTDFRSLMQAKVDKSVIQRIVYEAPPVDGWQCLEDAGLVLAHLDMAIFFARLDAREDLKWSVRLARCEASTEARRGTKRLIERLDNRNEAAEAELDYETEVGPGSVECQKVAALKAAIDARDF
jgi:hypothetical protein